MRWSVGSGVSSWLIWYTTSVETIETCHTASIAAQSGHTQLIALSFNFDLSHRRQWSGRTRLDIVLSGKRFIKVIISFSIVTLLETFSRALKSHHHQRLLDLPQVEAVQKHRKKSVMPCAFLSEIMNTNRVVLERRNQFQLQENYSSQFLQYSFP